MIPLWTTMTCSRFASLPALRRKSTAPLRTTATPAESYPRYSSRRSPSMRTGTTSLGPIYPMIPHIFANLAGPHPRSPTRSHRSARVYPEQDVETRRSLTFSCLRLLFVDPTFDVSLFAGRHRQGAGGHVFPDCRSAADVRALADRDRRDQLRVAAYERAVFDHGLI